MVKENLYQIVCIDVTEEYKLKHELENEKSEITDRIEQDFKASIDDIVCNWKYVIKLLRCGDRTERSNNTIKELYKAAHFLGLELDIEGNIPNTRLTMSSKD